MSSIIDNRDNNTLQMGLQQMTAHGSELRIATAFFSLDALLLIAENLSSFSRIRILFGDEANATQRQRLLKMLRDRSDADLLTQRDNSATLKPLQIVEQLFASGKVEARCYTARKFHAKAYIIDRPNIFPSRLGVIGSGNFTRPGLTQNIELNVHLAPEQVSQLDTWYEERWNEAQADVVTENVLDEIRRQIQLYDPYILYLKALYLWGKNQEAETPALGRTKLLDSLDPHQEQGFLRSLSILEKQHGVMVCDGVGLGKSFIALALIEHYCRLGQNVLLIAPKGIMDSSWDGYLNAYLNRYREPFGSIFEIPMTDLGFDPAGDDDEIETDNLREKREQVNRLYERSDVVVVDESHNFRTSSAARFKNLMEIVRPYRGRKKVILLTATPINTAYRDISNQLSIITHNEGNIAGYGIEQVRRYANTLDRNRPSDDENVQLSLGLLETPSEVLNNVLASVVIQRSRATCKALAEIRDRAVHFPKRTAPRCIEISIKDGSALYRELIRLADKRFRPGVELYKLMRAELEKADKNNKKVLPVKLLNTRVRGIKLAAFLTEQYRKVPIEGVKTYNDEVHLARLVFSNSLKQLESSPVAFQGIIQNLGAGLLARLKYVFGDAANALIEPHLEWVKTPLFKKTPTNTPTEELPLSDIEEDGDVLDASGAEADSWLLQAVKERGLPKKLKVFTAATFDVDRWRDDIASDLGFLKEVHDAALAARDQPDPKLEEVLPELRKQLALGRRVLVFTQSQRTAEYLETELKHRLSGVGVARIDSRVEKTRAAILHAFCPGYNPHKTAPSVPKRVDVLICTDVLSEGVNLQEAGAILSYDIHWNPVRLIQRIGRVDRRLNPDISPEDHSFDIVNVLPPKEINDIIELIGTIENRTLLISQALGLDVSFFKSSDPAGNLKEFNSTYDGEISSADQALNAYASLSVDPPDEKAKRILEALPPGAFGVWSNAPVDGLFALFTMEPKSTATQSDLDRFSGVIGRPVLILERQGKPTTSDAGEILTLLSKTEAGVHSGFPSDESNLTARLKSMKNNVRGQFAEIGLPSTILPSLVCWLELRKGKD